MTRVVSLHNNPALFFFSSCSSRYLRYKLKSLFIAAEIGKIQRQISVKYANKGNILKVMPFYYHLSSHKYLSFARGKIPQNIHMRIFTLYGIVIHSGNLDIREKVVKLLNNLL